MRKLNAKRIAEVRQLIRQHIEDRKAKQVVLEGPFDESYEQAIRFLDEEPLSVGLNGTAYLR